MPIIIEIIHKQAIISTDHCESFYLMKFPSQPFVICIRKVEQVVSTLMFTPAAFQRIWWVAIKKCLRKVELVDCGREVAVDDLEVAADFLRYFMKFLNSVFPSADCLSSLCVHLLFGHVPPFILSLHTQSEERLPHTDIEPSSAFKVCDSFSPPPAFPVFEFRAWSQF